MIIVQHHQVRFYKQKEDGYKKVKSKCRSRSSKKQLMCISISVQFNMSLKKSTQLILNNNICLVGCRKKSGKIQYL